jgi:glycosyltransferase involved in cell wall biosynthesis
MVVDSPRAPEPVSMRDDRSVPAGAGLLVFSDDWGRHPSSCQHLIGRLLARHQVAWVNTIGMRPPRLDRFTFKRVAEKLRGRVGPHPPPSPGAVQAPRIFSPTMWPWFRTGLDRRINRSLLGRQLASVAETLPRPRVVVTTIPIVADLVGILPVDRWVYYCVDDFAAWPGLDSEPLRQLENSLVSRADILIAAGETLRRSMLDRGRECLLLTHGVDLQRWAVAGEVLIPPGFEGLERPLIVFWGLIDRRLDTEFLRRLAEDLDQGTIVLVGPEMDPDPTLTVLPRLVRRPAMAFHDLPALAHVADVLIMPYADLPVTRAMEPLKLKEYLATGKPVVVRDLPGNRSWSDALDLADSPATFSEAVRRRLVTGPIASQGVARSRLAEESWDQKAALFEKGILSDLELSGEGR